MTGSSSVMKVLCVRHVHSDSPLALADRLLSCPSLACVSCSGQSLLYDFDGSNLPRELQVAAVFLENVCENSIHDSPGGLVARTRHEV